MPLGAIEVSCASLLRQINFLIKSSWNLVHPTYIIEKMDEAGVRSATFGADAASELHHVDNIGGFKVVTLEEAYDGTFSTYLGDEGDFRSKFGSHRDLVHCIFTHPQLSLVSYVSFLSCTSVIPRVVPA